MAQTASIEDGGGRRPRRGGTLLGLLMTAAAAGGGFYATWSGLVALPALPESAPPPPALEVAFVPIEPIVVSLGPRATARHLVFEGHREVAPGAEAEVVRLMPRVMDVLNTYLRAVEERDFEEPGALPRMRGHMLRRVRIVAGPDRVRDLLVTRFLLK